jgi:hypothetical protein
VTGRIPQRRRGYRGVVAIPEIVAKAALKHRNERWFLYLDTEPSRDVSPLLAEIDADPTGIFWG